MSFLQILDSIDLLSRYTKLNVEVETIGSTYEKRQENVLLIFFVCGVGVVNIMKGSFTRPLRVTRIINPGAPHVYIQSGLHAREWIAQVSVSPHRD